MMPTSGYKIKLIFPPSFYPGWPNQTLHRDAILSRTISPHREHGPSLDAWGMALSPHGSAITPVSVGVWILTAPWHPYKTSLYQETAWNVDKV